MLRGEVKADNGVNVTVMQAATGEEDTTFIPFEVINVPSVIWRVLAEDQTVGYVQITRFTESNARRTAGCAARTDRCERGGAGTRFAR